MIKRLLQIILLVSTIAFGQKEFGKVTLPLGRVQVQKGGSGDFKKANEIQPDNHSASANSCP